METEKINSQGLTAEEENISLVFPKDREAYVLKVFGLIVLAVFITWVIFFKSKDDNIYLFGIYIILWFSLLVALYEKIIFFLKVDKITADENYFYLLYKNHPPKKYSFDKLGVKISFDVGGTGQVSFYDLPKKKKIFFCKENEVDKNDLHALLSHLFKTVNMDTDIIKNGTYREVIPLVANFDDKSHSDSLVRYYDKYYFYNVSGYGWLVYPLVVAAVLATLYFAK